MRERDTQHKSLVALLSAADNLCLHRVRVFCFNLAACTVLGLTWRAFSRLQPWPWTSPYYDAVLVASMPWSRYFTPWTQLVLIWSFASCVQSLALTS